MPALLNTLTERLALPFRWLMVVGIAYTIASGLLDLLGASPLPSESAPSAVSGTRARPSVDIERLVARNLFGAPVGSTEAAAAAGQDQPAVVTQLPLDLNGVFVGEGTARSAAIIAERGQPGQLYQVGDTIANSATLEAVFPDHVVLRRAGVAESLFFLQPDGTPSSAVPGTTFDPDQAQMELLEQQYREQIEEPVPYDRMNELDGTEPIESLEDQGLMMPDAAAAPVDASTNSAVAGADPLAQARERMRSDPAGALQSLGMTPVAAGGASGYRIDNLADSPYLGQTGLQSGDVILSVNGRPVGNLGQDRLEVDNIITQGAARIEVQRGSRRFFVTAALP